MYELAKYVFWSGGFITKYSADRRSSTNQTEYEQYGIDCERTLAAVPVSLMDGLTLGELIALSVEGVPKEKKHMMDDMVKQVLAGWVRHLLTVAAGGLGWEAWFTGDVMNGAIAVILGFVAFGWSYINKYLMEKKIAGA